jgi:hypothetical protein
MILFLYLSTKSCFVIVCVAKHLLSLEMHFACEGDENAKPCERRGRWVPHGSSCTMCSCYPNWEHRDFDTSRGVGEACQVGQTTFTHAMSPLAVASHSAARNQSSVIHLSLALYPQYVELKRSHSVKACRKAEMRWRPVTSEARNVRRQQ